MMPRTYQQYYAAYLPHRIITDTDADIRPPNVKPTAPTALRRAQPPRTGHPEQWCGVDNNAGSHFDEAYNELEDTIAIGDMTPTPANGNL